MDYRLVILGRARRDAQHIYDWIRERTRAGADSWWNAFEAATRAVRDKPLGYGLAPEDDLVEDELRQYLFKTRKGRTYRAVFVVVGNEVRILRVRGPGQPLLEEDEVE